MIKSFFNKIFILFVFLSINTFGQTDKLKNLSRDEIHKRALEMGFTDEDYLKFQQLKLINDAKEAEDTSKKQNPRVIIPFEPKSLSEFHVPAFRGRENADSLPAYGYNIFTYSPTTFEPSVNIPAPKSYIVGPGDEIIISLWGETQMVHKLKVSNDGTIYIPDVGLVAVSGLSMSQLKSRLYERLSKVYSSLSVEVKSGGGTTHLEVSTGSLRSVKIYVLGEINKPGGYTIPALSSAFTALYYSGGPTLNGSLRNVKILRGGKTISEIDVYSYLLNGDKSEDMNLEDGDIVYVPIAGKRAAVAGAIFRPAIYELKDNETLRDLLKYSGGLTFNTYYQRVHVERVIPFDQRDQYTENILSLDINFNSVSSLKNSNYKLEDGDVVTLFAVNTRPENRITITGNVRKPGTYELLNKNMTVRDLVMRADSLFPDTFTEEALLIRTLPSEKKLIQSFNLENAMKGIPGDNFILKNRDEIRIFNVESFHPTHFVEISGEVKNPGKYSRYENMTVSDLIVLAGGITDSAYTKNIEVARLDTTHANVYYQTMIVNLPDKYWEVSSDESFYLKDFDHIVVKADTAKNFQDSVVVFGEVKFPGAYTISKRGERILDFLNGAGSFKNSAYKLGIYVERNDSLFIKSESFLVPDSLRRNLFNYPVYNKTAFASFSKRIPIYWDDVEQDNSSIYNLVLQPGDKIVVPKDPGVVYVMGEVGIPSNVPYEEGAGLSYYIKNAGGYSPTAATGDELVILPNGKKWSESGLFFIPNPSIPSGSTIFVPTFVETESNTWPTIRDIVTVVTSAAVLVLTAKALSK